MESGIVCSKHQRWLSCAICLYWPFILELIAQLRLSSNVPTPTPPRPFLYRRLHSDRWIMRQWGLWAAAARDVTVHGRDPTGHERWKLSLPRTFYSPLTRFSAEGARSLCLHLSHWKPAHKVLRSHRDNKKSLVTTEQQGLMCLQLQSRV